MTSPPKIFYSWQSDLPNATNRTFIEECIKAAVKRISQDPEVLLRPEVDKDTLGVPGSPSIVDTIFRKISESQAFIADLTFVSEQNTKKSTPNPNVLIEYGWALKSLGNERIIAVMNEAYGEATKASVPFNISGFRWPRTYHVSVGMSSEEKSREKKSLIKFFEEQIRAILEMSPVKNFISAKAQPDDPSLFIQIEEPLGHGSSPSDNEEFEFFLADHPRLFLRLLPTIQGKRISSKKGEDLLRSSNLSPMGFGLNPQLPKNHNANALKFVTRNSLGAIVANQMRSNSIGVRNITQLFESCELWGIDTYAIAEERCKRGYKDWLGEVVDEEMMFPHLVESTFCKTLADFVEFAIRYSNVSFPMEVRLGASQIRGYKVAVSLDDSYKEISLKGRAVKDSIEIVGKIDSKESLPTVLEELFEQFWEELGISRSQIHGLASPLMLES